jgi:alpha-L-fucosidase
MLAPGAGLLSAVAVPAAQPMAAAEAGPYQANTQSLRKQKAPQWYEDAKFGIFVHWGVFAGPAYHEWYVEYISPKASYGFLLGVAPYTATCGKLPERLCKANVHEDAVKYHLANWGPDFAYDDFIPMFKAERFDPGAWAQLFQESRARYVVLTAKHGDDFALWPTKYTHRNAMETGPHRDLAGELLKAIRRFGLKMGFYHNTTYTFWDPRYPGTDWVDYVNNSIKELIDLYHPSTLWGDVREGPIKDEEGKPLPADYWNRKEVLAYFYNHSDDPSEVVANDRWGLDVDGKPLGDFATPERTNINSVSKAKWEECDSLDPTSWGYSRRLPDSEYMTPNEVVHYLVDAVSKNGNLLLNPGPKADGTIPEVRQSCLRSVGEWLRVNGEAIYGSRPWDNYKEGDVRFTRKGNVLYAIALEWLGEELRITSLAGREVFEVEMLGLNDSVT